MKRSLPNFRYTRFSNLIYSFFSNDILLRNHTCKNIVTVSENVKNSPANIETVCRTQSSVVSAMPPTFAPFSSPVDIRIVASASRDWSVDFSFFKLPSRAQTVYDVLTSVKAIRPPITATRTPYIGSSNKSHSKSTLCIPHLASLFVFFLTA